MVVRKTSGWLATFLSLFGRNAITLFGASVTTASAVAILTFVVLGALNVVDFLYVGIIAFLILPGFFVFGLLLIPLGVWWERHRQRAQEKLPPELRSYPTLDLNKPQVRRALAIIAVLTFVNLLIISTVSYRGVTYMETPEFCGKVCHSVMAPEFASYEDSPHARVDCVECHIGPGAPWFVRSKLSGAGQVIAVNLDTYETPIPTPVANLRPSQDTCEQCHWPKRFTGDRIRTIQKFADDEANTQTTTVLLMHIGGAQAGSKGIHSWHIDPSKQTTYYTDDPKRLHIPVVEVKEADGKVTRYVSSELEGKPLDLSKMEKRRMDCIDCHSRPTHIFRMPSQALNEAMADGRIDKTIPSIKKASLDALNAATGKMDESENPPDPSKAEELKRRERAQIAKAIEDYYHANHADAYAELEPKLKPAIEAVQAIYDRNIFPGMRVTWGTYRTHIGHNAEDYPEIEPVNGYTPTFGCFRCHDEGHATEDGRTISQDCTLCHTPLAVDEEKPEVLTQLGLAQSE